MDFTQKLVRKIEKYCRENELLPSGGTVLCACSGGPDSMALLNILLSLREQMSAIGKPFNVAAAHFEHGIRGAASLADASFVRAYCQENNIEIYMGAADVPAEAQKAGESLETAARRLRYEFLYDISRKMGNGLIATAHHADDQAETVLMHMLRGSGTNGLGGIRPRNGLLIRPLLCVSKAQLMEYCKLCGIEFRIDTTNGIPDCLRNKIRLELIPLLKREYNGNIVDALNRLSRSSSEDEAFLQAETERAWKKVALSKKDSAEAKCFRAGRSLCISRKELLDIAPALQGRVLQRVAFELVGKTLERIHIELCLEWLAKGESGTGLELAFGIRAKRSYAEILFCTEAANKEETASPIAAGRLEWKILDSRPEGSLGVDTILCDADRLKFPLDVRTRRPGDVIRLTGGRKKLKDFFIDIKLPQAKRDTQPLVVSDDTIIWLPGLRQAKVAWTDAKTRHYAVISYKSV